MISFLTPVYNLRILNCSSGAFEMSFLLSQIVAFEINSISLITAKGAHCGVAIREHPQPRGASADG